MPLRKVIIIEIIGDFHPEDRGRVGGSFIVSMINNQRHRAQGKILTGLVYMHRTAPDLHEVLDTVHRPLNTLGENELCPGQRVLDNINASLR